MRCTHLPLLARPGLLADEGPRTAPGSSVARIAHRVRRSWSGESGENRGWPTCVSASTTTPGSPECPQRSVHRSRCPGHQESWRQRRQRTASTPRPKSPAIQAQPLREGRFRRGRERLCVRISSCEQRGHRATLRSAVDGGPLTADSIHDSSNVVHPLLERGNTNVPVRHPGAPLVEDDQSAELGQALREVGPGWVGQLELKVAVDSGHPNDVDGTVADDLVSEAHFTASGVSSPSHPSRMPGQPPMQSGDATSRPGGREPSPLPSALSCLSGAKTGSSDALIAGSRPEAFGHRPGSLGQPSSGTRGLWRWRQGMAQGSLRQATWSGPSNAEGIVRCWQRGHGG